MLLSLANGRGVLRSPTFYFEEEPGRRAAANKDEARRCRPATFLAPIR